MLQKPRGTRDFLPDEMERRRYIELQMLKTAGHWGYRQVCTPTFENLELFTIKSGEGIVQEMYAFEDKGGRKLALRPEITAPVLRMYVNEAKVMPKPLRWCYVSDCFRYERPQKGRYRQFWQFGVEQIGADTAAADAEVILLGDEVLQNAGVSFEMQIGHLAPMKHLLRNLDQAGQRRVMAYLDKRDFEGLRGYLSELDDEALYDPLIALVECREIGEVQEIAGDVPELNRVSEMLDILDAVNTQYTLNFGIARGLDYYTGMVFEAFASNLGAENQILGGGSYRLAHLFGGEDTPSCGFAIGFDRVLVSLGEFALPEQVVVAVLYTPDAACRAFEVAEMFRDAGIRAELNLTGRGIGAQMKHASRAGDFAIVIGARECADGTVTLKNLHSGEQQVCSVDEAIAGVKVFGSR